MSRVVAAFDFDGTLIRGDSLVPFLRRVCSDRRLAYAATVAWRDLARIPRGGLHRDRAKAALLGRALRGLDLEMVLVACEAYAEILEHRLRPDVLARARWHEAQGHEVVVVSASPELYLRPLTSRLGFRSVLATRLEVDDAGLLTGRLLGANVRGQEKVERLRSWLGAETALLWVYGDSDGDRELLAAADVATRVTSARLPAVPSPPGAASSRGAY